ncbi:cysteine desulfurase [Candidatus Microgenomates bacterium]|nr:MAG: cysteine desulfurase [Candidatus Microgenomates bacterium]
MDKVYLDYAATTPVRPEVVEAMRPYWGEKFGNASSLHSFGKEARIAVEEAREKIASILNAETEEIVFTGSITESDNLAILGLTGRFPEKVGQLITSEIEHHAVLDTFITLEKRGYRVSYLPVNQEGQVNLKALEEALRTKTLLVSVMSANNEVGTIEPVEEIGEIINAFNKGKKDWRVYFHTDAAAFFEYLPLDVKRLKVDLLSLGPHKFGGPKGVGVLYVKKDVSLSPLYFGGHQEFGLCPGTEAVPLIVGAAKAFELASKEKEENKNRVTVLRDRLIKGVLEKIPGVFLTGDAERRLPGLASFSFRDVEGEAVLLRLDKEGIAASSGSACTSGELKPSHVLLAMGIPPEEAHGSVRFSLGRETTKEDIDYVLEKLPRVIEDIRKMTPKL